MWRFLLLWKLCKRLQRTWNHTESLTIFRQLTTTLTPMIWRRIVPTTERIYRKSIHWRVQWQIHGIRKRFGTVRRCCYSADPFKFEPNLSNNFFRTLYLIYFHIDYRSFLCCKTTVSLWSRSVKFGACLYSKKGVL